MAKKKAPIVDPFALYDLDFANKVAYMFPKNWSETNKRKFRSLSAERKLEACQDGGGFLCYNEENLRIRWIPPEIF